MLPKWAHEYAHFQRSTNGTWIPSERIRALCMSNVEGPVPMELGPFEDENWDEHGEVQAVYLDT